MSDNEFEKSPLNTVKRLPKRGYYDKETIFGILDEHFICHLGWEVDGQPFLIPTAYGRKGDTLYVHGSSKSRMLSALTDGRPLCMVVTIVDGLVLARSAFHHSMNYRSAIIYGHAHELEGEEKMEALRIVSEQILAGRWDEVRLPSEIELKATTVLAIDIDSASAKIRTGPPSDDDADYDLPVWAGVLPAHLAFDQPIVDPAMKHNLPISLSVKSRFKSED
ncbi:MAG: pyridoxamine 5'-phosphate oxidase family protein [Saprospiraceae bacterium]|uniref:Pyridoxamine 5'-phosphate oxidase family protein n=1 Tax=Candidatus Opimibacter skivensis TaxID=2982028 RepID=A0A9D7SUN4_9BACT|nr:pyridoxamine 5'-phosphate oxidase family protein [Candidatus Opimibacter skivensis]